MPITQSRMTALISAAELFKSEIRTIRNTIRGALKLLEDENTSEEMRQEALWTIRDVLATSEEEYQAIETLASEKGRYNARRTKENDRMRRYMRQRRDRERGGDNAVDLEK